MLQLDKSKPAASVIWQRGGEDEKNTDALHSIMATPFIRDGYIYGVCSYGELRCLDRALKEQEKAFLCLS